MAAAPKISKRKGDDIPAPATKAVKKSKTESPNGFKVEIVKETPNSVTVTQVEKKTVTKTKSPKAVKDAVPSPAAKAAASPAAKSPKTNGKSAATTNGSKSAKAAVGSKASAKKTAPVEEEPQEITLGSEFDSESDGEAGDAVADQAAALLAGFESDSEDASDVDAGIPLEKIPAAPVTAESKKQIAAAQKKKGGNDGPGTVYVGRIPHGFFEPQMRAYFTQFGPITKLRLSRNKKTGRSKHYAFVEFDSASVADIVARTMNKYLLFNHILQVKVMNQDSLPEGLWEGANKRFKIIPRAKMEGRGLKMPKSREAWERKEEKERKRREGLKRRMGELGYEFEMPDIKRVRDLELTRPEVAIEGEGEGEGGAVQAIEAAPAAIEEEKAVEPVPTPAQVAAAKKGKKSKAVAPEVLAEKLEEAVIEDPMPAVVSSKGKKTKAVAGSKRAAPVDAAAAEVAESTPEKAVKKSKTKEKSQVESSPAVGSRKSSRKTKV